MICNCGGTMKDSDFVCKTHLLRGETCKACGRYHARCLYIDGVMVSKSRQAHERFMSFKRDSEQEKNPQNPLNIQPGQNRVGLTD